MALLVRQLVSIGLKFVGVLLIARVLGPSAYGAYVAAFGIYGYTALLGQFGIGVYLIRHPEPLPERLFASAYTLLAAISLLLLAALGIAFPLLVAWVNVPDFGPVMLVLALALPAQLLAIPAMARLERALDFKTAASIEVLAQLGFYAIAIPAIALGSGPIALAYAWLGQQVLLCLAAHIVTATRPVFLLERAALRDMLGYSAGFSVANWIWQLRMLVNPLIVAPALGAQAVGVLGLTIGLLEMLSVIKSIAWRLAIAVLGRVQQDHARLRRAITEGMELQALTIGTILLGFGWVGDWLVPTVFGAHWSGVMEIYPFIALAYFTNALFSLHTATLTLLRHNRDLALFHACHILLFAGSALALVPMLGLRGYGWAEMVALAGYLLLHSLLARAIGSPSYRCAALWWFGVAIGLFWRDLGWWAIAAPFLALLVPPSPLRLRQFHTRLSGA